MTHTVRGFHILVFSRCVVALLFSTACVSTPQYEQVSSAADVEREAHRRTHVSLEAAEQKIAQLESRLTRSEGSLTDESGARAELDLKQTKTERELESSRELATELRQEIGRLRDNLERSHDELVLAQAEKDKVAQELAKTADCVAPVQANPAEPSSAEPGPTDTSPADPGRDAQPQDRPQDAHATEGGHEDSDTPPPPLADRGA